MYLKSIEVYGFKSFADKITFKFQDGITGIVGPNGSGKSNVADAVRWVLGEQSAKQLRGARMEDVIFSGTESRKPLGTAYVAITLNNDDHSLPIDYNEVTVARRVYRSGESEYLINGTTCRLKDVHAMFFDTGIGKEGYSIIGQGQIDRILSAKSEERRELFDEAAGIVKYKKNKATTEKSLEAEKQSLYRVNDILSELEVQVAPLKEQSETARQYLQYKEELKHLDINVFLLEYNRLNDLSKEIEKKIEISNDQIEQTNEQYEYTKKEYEMLEEELEALSQTIEGIRNEMNDGKLQKEKLEGEIKVLKEQINTVRNNDENIAGNLQKIEHDLESKQADLEKYNGEKTELEELLRQEVVEKKKLEEALLLKADETALIGEHIAQNKENILGYMNESASLQGTLQRYDTMLEQIQIRKVELKQRLLTNQKDEYEFKEQLQVLTAEHEELTEQHSHLDAQINETETLRINIQKEEQECTSKRNNTEQQIRLDQSRLETLKNMKERYDGYGNSIKRVMDYKDKNPGIHGVVADIIKVNKEYETAVETALGGSIQHIVTDSSDTAKTMIEYLKKNRYGRATFLPLTSITNKNPFYNEKALLEPGVIGLASSLVKTAPEYKTLTEYLLGRIVVVDHINNAIALAKKYKYSMRIVTVEGESLNPGGSMTGGAFRNTSNLLGRRREIEELRENGLKNTKLVESLTIKITELDKQRVSLKEQGNTLHEQRQALFLKKNTNELNQNQINEKIQQLTQSLNRLTIENRDLEKQIEEIRKNKEELNEGSKQQDDARQECQTQIDRYEEQLLVAAEEKKVLEDQVARINLQYSSLVKEIEFSVINIDRVEVEKEQLTWEQQKLVSNKGNVAEEIKAILEKVEEMQATIAAVEKRLSLQQVSLSEQEQKKIEINLTHKDFFQKREQISKQITDLDKESFRLNSQQTKVQEDFQHLSQYMWEEYEITYHSVKEQRDELLTDLAGMKKALNELKANIRKLGVVNVNAIEDYKNVSERYEFLSTQRDDILKAEENLKQIILEMDIAMREQFTKRFAEIQEMFDQVFKELFGGGKARLELEDEEDILETGIKIISQPPGKKLQNMMQLSGGEKALTAIALLFAIQRLKPSPFCLLDEIEAALDDANVKRFANYLHKLTKDTQFIVITHRRGTMVAADVLYGITMQEKGVSTLVSVDLIENELDK